ncbi:hypothetical protein, partial [Pantoea ananatis]
MPTDNSLSAAYQMTCLCFTSLRHCTRALLQVHRCPLNAGKGMRPVRNGAEMRGYLPDRRRKKALNVSSGLLYVFDAWQFMNHAVIHPSGRCFAAFKSVR